MTNPADQRSAELVEIVARAMCTDLGGNPDTPLFMRVGFDAVPTGKLVWTEYIGHATAALDALTAAGVDLECWREIESVPRDQTPVLLYLPIEHLRAHFHTGWYGSNMSTGVIGGNFGFDLESPPTHWRPLPLPPKDKSNG